MSEIIARIEIPDVFKYSPIDSCEAHLNIYDGGTIQMRLYNGAFDFTKSFSILEAIAFRVKLNEAIVIAEKQKNTTETLHD